MLTSRPAPASLAWAVNRVWEGVHFRFSDTTGVRQGLRVAHWDLGRLDRLLGSR